jgi:hypothetical protein
MSRPLSCAGFEDRPGGTRRTECRPWHRSADDGDPRDLVEPECVLGGGERALFGAQAEAVAGVSCSRR